MTEERLEIGSTYLLKKTDFCTLLASLEEKGFQNLGAKVENSNLVYGPISKLTDLPQGYISEEETGHFRLTKTNYERYFDYIPDAHSWKQFLFPSRLELFTLRKNSGWKTELPPDEQPKYAFIGVRGCELSAIQIQDVVFIRDDYTDPVYAKRRQNLFTLTVNCLHPAGACFCTSLHTGPKAAPGFDLSLTELDDVFLLETGSEMGRQILQKLPVEAASRVRVEISPLPGLELLGLLESAKTAILVDAVQSGAEPGRVHIVGMDQVDSFGAGSGSAHGFGVAETLALGRQADPDSIPETVVIIGIEILQMELGQPISPEVQKSIPEAVSKIEEIAGAHVT
jgi:hydrogenase maturation protease